MKIEAIFIDMDDTLYPSDSGLWMEIRSRIYGYISEHIGVTYEEAKQLSASYVKEYGTTFKGLSAHYPIDAEKYFQVVHDIDLAKYIKPAPVLKAMLDGLPIKKYIFTNADAAHAARALNVMGLTESFEGIIDIHTLEPTCKPHKEAFETAMKIAGVSDPRSCVFVDDLIPNVLSANAMGMVSILFGAKNSADPYPIKMSDWKDFPELLRGNGYDK